MRDSHIVVPAHGDRIEIAPDGTLVVPNHPIIPYIEGDGIGVDVTPAMQRVADAAVERAYGGTRSLAWMEVYAGGKALERYGAEALTCPECGKVSRAPQGMKAHLRSHS